MNLPNNYKYSRSSLLAPMNSYNHHINLNNQRTTKDNFKVYEWNAKTRNQKMAQNSTNSNNKNVIITSPREQLSTHVSSLSVTTKLPCTVAPKTFTYTSQYGSFTSNSYYYTSKSSQPAKPNHLNHQVKTSLSSSIYTSESKCSNNYFDDDIAPVRLDSLPKKRDVMFKKRANDLSKTESHQDSFDSFEIESCVESMTRLYDAGKVISNDITEVPKAGQVTEYNGKYLFTFAFPRFSKPLLKNMHSLNYINADKLQANSVPCIMDTDSNALICSNSNVTKSYLLPILALLCKKKPFVSESTGPRAVIICSSKDDVISTYALLQLLIVDTSIKSIRLIENEFDPFASTQRHDGYDIAVIYKDSLPNLVNNNKISFTNVKYLVVENALECSSRNLCGGQYRLDKYISLMESVNLIPKVEFRKTIICTKEKTKEVHDFAFNLQGEKTFYIKYNFSK